mmetsp:Transcript_36328/g.73900  ORF Transcript_36328/g.73900 Transcript_36328/m.73900 type:complete len:233 (+) Transcript_36328:193-891(+)|eukprot:CAMPEP_0178695092 /NCGR_PEP_ID=MMETSP0699-20121125/8655_1 /TAXON_ID=265572 /ORGANISM="Extubocellulus spinifer, Strain CCMP396" /LENGTH=232 /DNA_ID=CAMNT_0020340735 /DNA_START=173 /DNA_END=871 /DNA_ORIENTATION=+
MSCNRPHFAAFTSSRLSAHAPAIPPPVLPHLVLLDRDGVVNEDVGSPGVLDSKQLQLTPGAGMAIGRVRRRGVKVALVTNQSCVGKGLISGADLEDIHNELQQMLCAEDGDAAFDNVYVCTSVKEDKDPRMKPSPGMILEAMNDFGAKKEECVFVGDNLTDMMAAKGGGVVLRILTETGYGKGLMGGCYVPTTRSPRQITNIDNNEDLNAAVPFVYTKNLAGAVDWLLSGAN